MHCHIDRLSLFGEQWYNDPIAGSDYEMLSINPNPIFGSQRIAYWLII